jgi:peptide-methionine (R)-S-oxide reductase
MDMTKAVNLDKLSIEQLDILQNRETETPFTGALLDNKENGEYTCAACGAKLFDSSAKFDSNSGWPSFDNAVPGAIKLQPDNTHGMNRTEAICANCSGHLGHLFEDGPKETTGKRYCVNSVCLNFTPTKSNKSS